MNKKVLQSMEKQVNKEIANHRERLAELRRTKKLIDQLPASIRRLPVFDVYLVVWSFTKAELRLSLPWDVKKINQHKEALKAEGWLRSWSHEELGESSHTEEYSHTNFPFELHLIYKADVDGASCVINKIGEKKETREVVTPIYEVTCPEGEAEKVFEAT